MFEIQEELKKLPQKPGVYLMKDAQEQVIYVGKAVRLQNRVRQYFQNSRNHTPKTRAMVEQIRSFEYIVTDSESEALILECNLIKKYHPHYNILLKDDKTYPYIKVTVQEKFPRIFITHHVEKDKAKYYGPFTDVLAMKETVELLQQLFPIRKCKKHLPKERGKDRPCLHYHIGQCLAPCSGNVSEETYRGYLKEAMRFLEGKQEEILKTMEQEMREAAEAMEFEKAASLRDKIRAVQNVAQRQKMENTNIPDADVIAFVRAFEECLMQVFFIRGGKVTGRENFTVSATEEQTRSEILTAFVKQFYSGTAYIPKEILLQEPLLEEEREGIATYLSERRGTQVTLYVPMKGEKQKLVALAYKNAMLVFEQFGQKMKREERRTKGALRELQQALGMETPLRRVEAYDISHTQGFETVGSMVVFEEGRAKNSDYRKFKLRTVVGANEYASIREVLTRRFQHALQEKAEGKTSSFTRLPDLLLMDGGIVQVQAAEEVLQAFGIQIPVCGMVKDEKHRTKALLFRKEEIKLPLTSEGFRLVTRIQDEVHRFAITYHRKLRQERNLHSVLDDIQGIGAVRRKALLQHFGSVERIAQAEVAELLEAESMTIPAAEQVYLFFHREELQNT